MPIILWLILKQPALRFGEIPKDVLRISLARWGRLGPLWASLLILNNRILTSALLAHSPKMVRRFLVFGSGLKPICQKFTTKRVLIKWSQKRNLMLNICRAG